MVESSFRRELAHGRVLIESAGTVKTELLEGRGTMDNGQLRMDSAWKEIMNGGACVAELQRTFIYAIQLLCGNGSNLTGRRPGLVGTVLGLR
jgi:hypothetical protein